MNMTEKGMKTITIDPNAHKILAEIKDAMEKEGIKSPNFSETIRWMRAQIKLQR